MFGTLLQVLSAGPFLFSTVIRNVGGVMVKVAELIERLQKHDPELPVYLEDTEGTFKLEKVVFLSLKNGVVRTMLKSGTFRYQHHETMG